MGNRPEAVAGYVGGQMIGAVVVPLWTFAQAAEPDSLLRHADIGVLLTQSRMVDRHFVDDVAFCART